MHILYPALFVLAVKQNPVARDIQEQVDILFTSYEDLSDDDPKRVAASEKLENMLGKSMLMELVGSLKQVGYTPGFDVLSKV